jgi:hypothetical protein
MAVLCVGVAVVMGVMCQLHIAPHDHAIPASGNHENSSSSTFDALSCVTAVIPSVNLFPVLLFLMLYIWLPPLKPLAPAFELDIPPRHSLP